MSTSRLPRTVRHGIFGSVNRRPVVRLLSALLGALLFGGVPPSPGQWMPCAAGSASMPGGTDHSGMPGMPAHHHHAANCCLGVCCQAPPLSTPPDAPTISVVPGRFRAPILPASASRSPTRIAFLLPFATPPPASV